MPPPPSPQRTEVDTEAEEEEEEAVAADSRVVLQRLAAEARTRLQPTKDVMEFNEANCAAPLSGADAAWTDTSSQPPFVFGEAACRLAPGEPYDVVFPFEGGRFFSREDASIAEQRARAARILLHVIESELKVVHRARSRSSAAPSLIRPRARADCPARARHVYRGARCAGLLERPRFG